MMRWGFLGVACVVALVIGRFAPAQAADAPRFTKGQTITVIWDCVPEWVAQVASAQFGQPLSACYAETLTVQAVRSDGWLEVFDPRDKSQWTINPARMLGYTVPQTGQRAD